uniref:Nuclear autoantigenic sperm protein (histone-binding) n=1 Tax=Pundamilia nyererei TaxID=303518 RepID=A0A3B4GHT6_9CICH
MEAKKLIGTGKRHLVMGDVVSAVNVFQEACSMLAEKYGDTADECGEAFFLCGKSLLELASVLLQSLLPEKRSGEIVSRISLVIYKSLSERSSYMCHSGAEKTRDELRQQVYDAMAEKEKAEDPHSPVTGDEKSLSQETEMDGVSSVKSVREGSLGKETEIEQKADSSEEQTGNGTGVKPEEEEVGNLQLAWEMLEVAKVIYKRKESTEDQLMAAQAYLKLGEVSAESGNYPQALDDFQECLALQLKYLPPHIRLLAETHYHVATTLCYMDQYSQAIQHYNSSIKVIETRLAMLQEVIDAAEGADGAAEEKTELDELKLLLPDIREKVEDAKESQKTASAASQAIQQTLGGASTSSAFLCENGSTSSAAFATTSQVRHFATCVTYLVGFKLRKPEDESPVKDTDAKQAKQEATVNGSGDSSASNGNGVQEGKSQEASDRLISYLLKQDCPVILLL